MPPPLTPPVLLLLLLATPVALAQTTLGELLDGGAARVSGEAFKRDVVQRILIGTTPAGGTLEIMYAGNGSIAGSGTAMSGSIVKAPVNGAWTIDDQDRICSSMDFVGGTNTPGNRGITLPRRCQFWFKLRDSYFLSESDSDRHARIIRRTVATASAAPAPVTAATLPRAMKGNAYRTAGMGGARFTSPLSLSIATVNPDGTFEGVVSLIGDVCAAQEVPIVDGVLQNGELRFRAPMGVACELSFVLSTGKEHVLEGSAENRKARGVGRALISVWLDANP